MSKKELIEKVTPLYNQYKANKKNLSGKDAVMIMWEIGDYLKRFLEKSDIKPHTLYREIYGKSEGNKNIVQKSYITREFQGRCYRIRKIFSDKAEIEKTLPTLSNFIAFRECMPFFDNPKYKLVGQEKKKLLVLLNGNLQSRVLLRRIRVLQADKIHKKNPRTQKLHEVNEIKQNFIEFYNNIYHLLNQRDYAKAMENLKDVDIEYIKILARNTDSLSQEGLKSFDFQIFENIEDTWKIYARNLRYLLSQENARTRRRFRRVIKPERIARLADMLNALTSKYLYRNFK